MLQMPAPLRAAALLAASLMLFCTPARSVQVSGLYEADVLTDGQGARERQAGFRRALAEVLVKLTGDDSAASRPEVGAILDGASAYVLQYRYDSLPPQGDSSVESAASHSLYVRFSPSALERDLRGRGIALWGSERPETLVWLAVEHGRQRFLLGADVDTLLRSELQDAAQRRGLPLLLPLMDIDDQRALDYSDVRGGFSERILDASRRYAADAVLTGHLAQSAGGAWAAEWSLVEGGRPLRWSSADAGLAAVLDGGLAGLGRELGARFAVRGGGGGGDAISLRVNRVASLADYARVQRSLARMPVVREVQVRRASAGIVVFRLQLNGNAADFERAVSLRRVIAPAARDFGTVTGRDLGAGQSGDLRGGLSGGLSGDSRGASGSYAGAPAGDSLAAVSDDAVVSTAALGGGQSIDSQSIDGQLAAGSRDSTAQRADLVYELLPN